MNITRIVTCYRQWDLLGSWLDTPALHGAGISWLVVNDAPQDSPPPALVDIMNRRGVILITPLFNLGRSRARNLGVERAGTDYIEHIDGDDVPLPLPLDLNAISDARSLHVFPVPEFFSDEELKSIQTVSRALPIRAAWSDLLPRLHPTDVRPASLIWPKKLFLSLGGYDARYESVEDVDLLLRFHDTEFEIVRHEYPKQAYRISKPKHDHGPLHLEGALKMWERLLKHHHVASANIRQWQAKDTLRAWRVISKKLLQRFPALISFIGRRWR